MPLKLINGAQLWYDDWGGGAETLIFLHGYTGYRRMWGYDKGGAAWKLAHEFGTGRYRCIFLEARGCNESVAAPGPYTLQQQALDVLALADSLGLETFTFCGHSLGGGTGWHLAVTKPERLKKMILMAPAPSDGRRLGFKDGQEFEKGPRTHLLQHYFWPKYTEADEDRLIERERVLAENLEQLTEEWCQDRARMIISVPDEYWHEAWLSMARLRLAEKLPNLEMPILVLAGAVDNLLTSNIDDAHSVHDGVLHVFSGAGHEVARDDPTGVAQVIHAFMSGKTVSRKAYWRLVKKRQVDRGHGLPPRARL